MRAHLALRTLVGLIVITACLALAAGDARAQAKGLTVRVLAVYENLLPGVSKIDMIEVVIDPGGFIDGKPEQTILCYQLSGHTVSTVEGKTVTYGPGSTFMFKKGVQRREANEASAPNVQLVYRIYH